MIRAYPVRDAKRFIEIINACNALKLKYRLAGFVKEIVHPQGVVSVSVYDINVLVDRFGPAHKSMTMTNLVYRPDPGSPKQTMPVLSIGDSFFIPATDGNQPRLFVHVTLS